MRRLRERRQLHLGECRTLNHSLVYLFLFAHMHHSGNIASSYWCRDQQNSVVNDKASSSNNDSGPEQKSMSNEKASMLPNETSLY